MLHDNSIDNAGNRLESAIRMLKHSHLDKGWSYDVSFHNDEITIIEVPDNEKMLEGLPERIEVKIKIPEEYIQFGNMENLIQYGNDKQIDIMLDLTELKRYAGNRLIEHLKSTEEQQLVMNIPPKPFPMIQTIFQFGDSSLNLKMWFQITQKINDEILEIGNKNEPNRLIEYRFVFNLDTNEKSNMHITVPVDQRGNIESLIIFEKMMYYASLNLELRIYVDGEEEIYSEQPIFTTSFGSDNQGAYAEARLQLIKLYEDILLIERAFNVKFEVPSKITPNEQALIAKLVKIINEGVISYKLNDEVAIRAGFYNSEELKGVIERTKNDEGTIIRNEINESYVLFEKELDIGEIEQHSPPALLENVETAEEKLRVFEEGDLINLVLIPKEESSYVTIVYKKFNK